MKTYAILPFLSLILLLGCVSKDVVLEGSDEPIVYTWVELHADGRADTVFASDTNQYPQPLAWTYATSKPASMHTVQPRFGDTVYLNYGPQARDSLIAPVVRIENKAELLAMLDTLYRHGLQWPRANIRATHFQGDSIYVTVSDTQNMALLMNPSVVLFQYADSCSQMIMRTHITYQQNTVFHNDLGINPDGVGGDSLVWKFVLRNRFGFADSLEGVSRILTPPPRCAKPKVESCQPMWGIRHTDTLYSWVEGYADGRRDTLFAADSAQWPGMSPVMLETRDSSVHWIPAVLAPEPAMWTVCPSDSLSFVGGSSFPHIYTAPDTVYLNYGPDSLYPYVEPRVSLGGNQTLLQKSATAQYHTEPLYQSVWVSRFRGDSAQVYLVDSPQHFLTWSAASLGGCTVVNPCDSLQILSCTHLDYGGYYSTWPHLQMKLEANTSGVFPWTLVARNRFGYADTLQGSTLARAFTCGE